MFHPRSTALSATVITVALVAFGCSGTKSTGATAGRHDAGISLTPDPPTVSTQLSAVIDLPGVDPARCAYVWSSNGDPIAGATTPSLGPDRFHKGDRIAVEVRLPDGDPAKPLTAETQVADAMPVVLNASIMLDNTAAGPMLQVHAEAQDADGETVTLKYRWFKNGAALSDASNATLAATGLTPTDQVVVEVVAQAAGVESAPRRSEPFSLDNRAPQFSGAPAALSPGQPVLRYQAAATDPDGDPIQFELVEAPAGMTITKEGAMEWPAPAGDPRSGEYKVTLRVSDNKGGSSTQSFVIRVDTTKK